MTPNSPSLPSFNSPSPPLASENGSENVISPLSDLIVLTGATASGKTAAGIALARRLDAEIISLDSMAVYRRMDIGTAKPTVTEREGIPHHLIDVVEPWEEFSLAEYLRLARMAAEDIRSRKKKVLVVGGTPLYLKGLLRGIFEGPPADPVFRAEMNRLKEKKGPGALHARLQEVDPVAAQRLHPNDTKRLVRALEVFLKTGRPISSFQNQFDAPPPETGNRVYLLSWPRDVLYDRINRRVDVMMADGWLEEVRALLREERPLSKTALSGVGYRELIEVIEGRMEKNAAVERIKQLTRNFAKRQETWFRSFKEAIPFEELKAENGMGTLGSSGYRQ